ncbi:hypothetical protein EVAR_52215_1 [Eumeta japonica]|uniref:Uncharacterized protein n=1 Tax=Eumeta variegata TaxID=151549 RepID=A0A4C1Z415_EUMVA|nr:hypothetical protein EVAR_52215_1 [Eumeta japonica]
MRRRQYHAYNTLAVHLQVQFNFSILQTLTERGPRDKDMLGTRMETVIVARSTVDTHTVRVHNRASMGATTPSVPTDRPLICTCVTTGQGHSASRSYSTTGDHASKSLTARKR